MKDVDKKSTFFFCSLCFFAYLCVVNEFNSLVIGFSLLGNACDAILRTPIVKQQEASNNYTMFTSILNKLKLGKDKKQFISLTLKELNSLYHSIGQRCGVSEKDDVNHVYHPLEHEVFKKRVNDVVSSITKNGWKNNLHPFVIALCKDDNEFYCIDGQATIEGCNHIKADKTDSNTLPDEFDCQYIGELTLDEIDELTYYMNGGTPRKQWKSSDNVAADIRKFGGKPLEDFNKMKDFQFETDTRETAVNYMFTGQYVKRDTKAEDFKLRDNYELYADFYKSFVNESGKVYVDSGIISEDKKKCGYPSRHNITRTEGLAKLLMQTIDLCVYVCKKHNLNPCTYVPIYSRTLMTRVFNNETMHHKNWDNIMVTPKTRFADFAERANLFPTLATTFKGKLSAEIYRKDYRDFMVHKIAESKVKY